MTLDQQVVAAALRVTFGLKPGKIDLVRDAEIIIRALEKGEERFELIQRLGSIQLRAAHTVAHDDCARLADKLIEVFGNELP